MDRGHPARMLLAVRSSGDAAAVATRHKQGFPLWTAGILPACFPLWPIIRCNAGETPRANEQGPGWFAVASGVSRRGASAQCTRDGGYQK